MKVKLLDGNIVDADVLDALGFSLLEKGFSQEEITKKVRDAASDEASLLKALRSEGLMEE